MIFFQALASFIGRTAGKLLNAIFGWAVIALFGRTSPRQQTIFSGVVAMAAAWPLLLLGIAVPRIATFLLAFIPLTKAVSSGVLRAVWIALALLVPLVVGFVIAARSRGRTSLAARIARGFPVTIGLAAAFLFLFVTVPLLRIASALKGRSDEHVPLITEGDEYPKAASKIDGILRRFGIQARRRPPAWWAATPSRILARLGRGAFRSYVPETLAFWQGEGIQIALYPSDILVRGDAKKAAWTHGLLAESFASGPGLQSFDPEAQRIEREAQRVWRVYEENPRAHRNSRILISRLQDLASDLAALNVPYEQWQVVYREIAQLGRAIQGEPQLIASASKEEDIMPSESYEEYESLPTGRLLARFLGQITELLKKEIQLARAEVKSTLRSAIAMVVGFLVAGVLMLMGVAFLLTSVVLALAHSMAPWLAALVVGVVTLGIGAMLAMSAKKKGIPKPFERTQRTLKEDLRWAKERWA